MKTQTLRTLVIAATVMTAMAVVVHAQTRSEEHTSELQSLTNLVCRLLLEKKKHHRSHGIPEQRDARLRDALESERHDRLQPQHLTDPATDLRSVASAPSAIRIDDDAENR